MNGLGTATIGLGQRIGVEAGTYLEITGVFPQIEAEYGDSVLINVSILNKHTASIHAALTAEVDGIEIDGGDAWLMANTEYSWPLRFTMPNKSVSGTVYAWYEPVAGEWYLDDTANVPEIALKVPEVPPEEGLLWWPAIFALGLAGGVIALIFLGLKK